MKRWIKIALAVLLVAILALAFWHASGPREPVYQGKPLSSWLIAAEFQLSFGGSDYTWVPLDDHHEDERMENRNAEEAVRQAGTNAIPTLLRMLRARDSAWKVRLMKLVERQHIVKIRHRPAEERNWAGLHGFEVLGASAESAVPDLIEIANANISRDCVLETYFSGGDVYDCGPYCPILALAFIGPSAKKAVPSLLEWVTNAGDMFRSPAIEALGDIHAEPGRVVPVLINLVRGQRYFPTEAVEALAKFGPDARLAVPALVELLNSDRDRLALTNALKKIDPEIAAKAGVK